MSKVYGPEFSAKVGNGKLVHIARVFTGSAEYVPRTQTEVLCYVVGGNREGNVHRVNAAPTCKRCIAASR